jgi:hypothetical protein
MLSTYFVYICGRQTACGQDSLERVDGDSAAASSIDSIEGVDIQSWYLRVSYRIPTTLALNCARDTLRRTKDSIEGTGWIGEWS